MFGIEPPRLLPARLLCSARESVVRNASGGRLERAEILAGKRNGCRTEKTGRGWPIAQELCRIADCSRGSARPWARRERRGQERISRTVDCCRLSTRRDGSDEGAQQLTEPSRVGDEVCVAVDELGEGAGELVVVQCCGKFPRRGKTASEGPVGWGQIGASRKFLGGMRVTAAGDAQRVKRAGCRPSAAGIVPLRPLLVRRLRNGTRSQVCQCQPNPAGGLQPVVKAESGPHSRGGDAADHAQDLKRRGPSKLRRNGAGHSGA